MRVIGGTHRGRRLTAPAGTATRPTADRIRESLFNILAGCLQDKQVLDLFAGTGALGIEALSRGAAAAVFVDRAKAALAAIAHNLTALQLTTRGHVIRWDILKNLDCLRHAPHCFDLVFMDPPYDRNAVGPALAALLQVGVLAPGARIIVEHSRREPLPAMDALSLSDQRRFGKTLVSFMDSML